MRHSRSFKKRNISLENNNDKKRDFKFNEDYLIELSLLSSALISTYLFIISDIIFYDSTINSIEYIVGKNNANIDNKTKVDRATIPQNIYLER